MIINFNELDNFIRDYLLLKIKQHKWTIVYKKYPYMIRIKKQFKYSVVVMNIHWNAKGIISNISTHMNHPTKGKGQLYRKIKDLKEVEEYLINPRKHTNKGYGRN